MRKTVMVLASAVVAGVLLTGCSGTPDTRPPVPTAPATDSNGNAAHLVIPTDVVGQNAQLADDELRRVGFVNLRYGTQNTTLAAPDAQHLAGWTVVKTDPAGGAVAGSTDNIVLTVVKN